MTKTTDEVKEIDEVGKSVPDNLPIPMTQLAHENLIVLQGAYQIQFRKKITLKALGTKIFEQATPAVFQYESSL